MGKRRQPSNNRMYTLTYTHEKIPTDGHSDTWMRDLENKIAGWISTSGISPTALMNEDEIEYIFKHMVNSESDPTVEDGILTRFVKNYHMIGVQVGD